MNKPCHVCQTLVDKIATQDAAARAMLAALKHASDMLAENHGGSTATARVLIRSAIAQAEAAGIKVQS